MSLSAFFCCAGIFTLERLVQPAARDATREEREAKQDGTQGSTTAQPGTPHTQPSGRRPSTWNELDRALLQALNRPPGLPPPFAGDSGPADRRDTRPIHRSRTPPDEKGIDPRRHRPRADRQGCGLISRAPGWLALCLLTLLTIPNNRFRSFGDTHPKKPSVS
jgi:hypothetical protein